MKQIQTTEEIVKKSATTNFKNTFIWKNVDIYEKWISLKQHEKEQDNLMKATGGDYQIKLSKIIKELKNDKETATVIIRSQSKEIDILKKELENTQIERDGIKIARGMVDLQIEDYKKKVCKIIKKHSCECSEDLLMEALQELEKKNK